MLTNRQIDLVRQSFERVAPCAGKFAGNFYDALFGRQPALRLLFPDDLAAQKKKLVEMLEATIDLLDEPEKLVPVLEESGRRHALYGVRERHYEPVGAALLAALRETLGAAFDTETAAAWTRVFDVLRETMMRGARGLKDRDAAEHQKINSL